MLITNDHDGPGVVPGRYPGAAIPIHDGPTPESVAYQEERAQADGLAGRICAAAAEAARSQYVLLELVGEFDAMDAIRYWTGFKSLAHWLSWCCSMTPGAGAGTRPGRQSFAADAEDCWVVSGGPVVVFEGAGGHPGG
jgi:hypothetical protein